MFGGFNAQQTDYQACERFRLQPPEDFSDFDAWPRGLPRSEQAHSVDDAIAAFANEPTFNPVDIDWLAINKEFVD